MSDTELPFEDVHGPAAGNGQDDRAVTLENLVEMAKANFLLAYQPEVIAAMAELEVVDTARYMGILAGLDTIKGFRLTEFKNAIKRVRRESEPMDADKDAIAVLLDIVAPYGKFHTDGNTAFVDFNVGDHRETIRVKDPQFEDHLRATFVKLTSRPAPSEAINTIVKTVAALAVRDGQSRPVFRRIGASDDGNVLYLDLQQPDGSFVEVTADGWKVNKRPPLIQQDGESEADFEARDMPVRFTQSPHALPLPTPERNGSIDELRPFLVQRQNTVDDELAGHGKAGDVAKEDEDVFVLIVGWLLGALHPRGPYPGLGLGGPPGAGKTTLMRMLRRLIDPHRAMSRAAPKDERDLLISAMRSHVQSFDNISEIKRVLGDAMCRLLTGGGLATRTLYENDTETIFEAVRPILVTAITEIVTQADLSDRFIAVALPIRVRANQRPDSEVERDFVEAWPRILGSLLDAVATGLTNLPITNPPADLPRMAEFGCWVAACETCFGWPAGRFLDVYRESIEEAQATIVESEQVLQTIIAWAKTKPTRPPPEFSAGTILKELGVLAGFAATQKEKWPRTPRALVNRFRTYGPMLAKQGIFIQPGRLLAGRRQWKLQREPAE